MMKSEAERQQKEAVEIPGRTRKIAGKGEGRAVLDLKESTLNKGKNRKE